MLGDRAVSIARGACPHGQPPLLHIWLKNQEPSNFQKSFNKKYLKNQIYNIFWKLVVGCWNLPLLVRYICYE
jgi:hypothetical protein